MSTSEEFLARVRESLSPLNGITFKKMMGEYLLYCNGTLIGGLYDDRLLLKPTATARAVLDECPLELPYEGAKPMIRFDRLTERELLQKVCEGSAKELFNPKRKK